MSRLRSFLPLFAARCLLALAVVLGVHTANAADFLPPEQAFAFEHREDADGTVLLRWQVAPGYHLYRDRLSFTAKESGATWSPVALPPAEEIFDTNFNKVVAVYTEPVEIRVQVTQGKTQALEVGWQGCADDGLCYPPTSQSVQLSRLVSGASDTSSATEATISPPSPSSPSPSPAVSDTDAIASTLASGSLLRVIGVFFLAGALLSLTPCVLPMVPILSSLIAGQNGPVSRRRGLSLSMAYSLGMAIIYSGFGMAAGLAGEGLAAALQNPWVLGAFAVLLSTLAMSMFGFYELQMPSAIQTRITQMSNRMEGGSYLGVFLMGGLSALVVGPCVAAPLAGALVYISQTRDIVLGGTALFAMAMGMSLPLLLVGVSAGALLPRAGTWMEKVKQVFGMMLLGVAIWMVSPVIPATAHMMLWAAWLVTAAALMGLFGSHHSAGHANGGHRGKVIARVLASAATFGAILLSVGAASGGTSVLQPLAHLAGSSGASRSESGGSDGLKFERIASVDQLDERLQVAARQGQWVMLDFYADWCVACKELESFTFSDPQVKSRLAGITLIQADVTANNPAQQQLLKRFGLFGPPGMVFFSPGARQQPAHKVIGYQDATEFLSSLDKAFAQCPGSAGTTTSC